MNRRSFLAAALAAPFAAPAIAHDRTRLKFILNWRWG